MLITQRAPRSAAASSSTLVGSRPPPTSSALRKAVASVAAKWKRESVETFPTVQVSAGRFTGRLGTTELGRYAKDSLSRFVMKVDPQATPWAPSAPRVSNLSPGNVQAVANAVNDLGLAHSADARDEVQRQLAPVLKKLGPSKDLSFVQTSSRAKLPSHYSDDTRVKTAAFVIVNRATGEHVDVAVIQAEP
jgi:hypothetical protein